MAVTIHVNGQSNSLVHKGSNGIARNTLPDVCKTPSPGGPIPVPYPIIISMSSDLVKGTKTVKVDGGNMAAIKGSEFSRCSGDEPGTAGGVKSSTNMKEATWITSSPDVKLEGKNACRLSDKMQMNHGNTVCLAGEMQVPVMIGVVELECEDGWDECQKKQMKAKASKMDATAKQSGGLQTRGTAKRSSAKKSWQGKFARDWNNPNPKGWPDFCDPSKQQSHFYDACAETSDPAANGMQADHVHEAQTGGHVKGPFLWLDGEVNGSSGRQIQAARRRGEGTITGFTTKNCN